MQYPNLFKKIVSFALALTLGLFAASFVVNIFPSLKAGHGHNHCQMQRENRELQHRLDEMEIENELLKRAIPDRKSAEYKDLDIDNWQAPPPPPVLKRHLKKDLERLKNIK